MMLLSFAPLVIGLGISHSKGSYAVVISICLDNVSLTEQFGGFMQMGHEIKIIGRSDRSDIIPKHVIKELVMVRKCWPETL